jgi:hypothetical protein
MAKVISIRVTSDGERAMRVRAKRKGRSLLVLPKKFSHQGGERAKGNFRGIKTGFFHTGVCQR